ncbi:MAG TPA: FIST N-terminal domain-containing protein [Steroidobacteraceae bacterium]|nr:FIST N-terminal domain-containing protein [Steroidobacteraceae bacterium]
MRWAATLDTTPALASSISDAAARLFRGLGGVEPDLVLAFVSSAHAERYDAVPELLAREFEYAAIAGSCGTGVIGESREIEQGPAIALVGATMPGVRITTRHVEPGDLPPVYAPRSAWMRMLGPSSHDARGFVLLCDPFSVDTEHLLQGVDRAYPDVVKLGGLASGGTTAGSTVLFGDGGVHRRGIVSLGFEGNVTIEATVAQGCRPVGEPSFVTASHDNLIREIDGRPPRDVLAELFDRLPAADRDLFATSLFVGIALPGDRSVFGQGDFLIRNVLGLDAQSGALWVGARVPERSVVQFHLRDAAASARDVQAALSHMRRSSLRPRSAGALLFSCVGRGIGLYGQPDHDSNACRRVLGDLPLGGMFCSGEIGPVHGATYVHGYTSVFGVFSPRDV